MTAEGPPNSETSTAIVFAGVPREGRLVPPSSRGARQSPAAIYLATLLTEKSRQTAREALQRITRLIGFAAKDAWIYLPWEELDYERTMLIRSLLLKDHSPTTVRLTLSMLTGVLHCAARAKYMTLEAFYQATDWPKLRAKRKKKGRALNDEELAQLHAYAIDLPAPYGTMMTALLAVGFGGGLRREEIANLKADAYNPETDTLTVLGKGQKERENPLLEGAEIDVQAWLAARRLLDLSSPTMFIALTADGRCLDRPLSPAGVWRRVSSICTAAGLQQHVAPHDLRRTYASRLLEHTDVPTVQGLMGHEEPSTTMIYDRRGEKAARKAARSLYVWGKRP
jgi:site-specific recombinase XerC